MTTKRFPIPPGVVGRVIQAAADPSIGVLDLAQLIEKDAVLSAQVLKVANSGFYLPHRPVATVERAVALMGTRVVRNTILTLGIREVVPTGNLGGFPIDVFWESSLRRAAAARALGAHLRLNELDELFTIGLCQDLGLIVNLQRHADLSTRLASVMHEPAEERLAVETAVCEEAHAAVGSAMLREWNLPESLTVPILHHHYPLDAPAQQRERAVVAAAAEVVADLVTTKDPPSATYAALERALAVLEPLNIGQGDLMLVVNQVAELSREFAALMGLRAPESLTYDEVLAIASEGLFQLNLSYESLTGRLRTSLKDARHLAEQLRLLNREIEHAARTDSLTGLANRRYFDEALGREMAQAERQSAALSVLLIDLDYFKRVNDTLGHQAGDAALRAVSQAIARTVRRGDTAARYGGEEFAVILPFTAREGAMIAAERLRQAIAELQLDLGPEIRSITASVGGHTLGPVQRSDGSERRAAMIAADTALYRAKQSGRNRVCWTD